MIRVERPRRVWDVVIAQSLKRDVRSPGLTNVADVTQDHANTRVRAHHWHIGLQRRGLPTVPQENGPVFLGNAFRPRAVTSLTGHPPPWARGIPGFSQAVV